MGAKQELQTVVVDFNTAGLTDVAWKVIDLSDNSTLDSGTAAEVGSEGAYKFSFTPAADHFYYVQARSPSKGKYWAGLWPVGKGLEVDIHDIVKSGGTGDLAAILADVTGLNGDAMRGTDNAALASAWTAALATALGNYTATRAAYLDELDFDLNGMLYVMREKTSPSFSRDTDSLEALREFLEIIRGADSDTLETLSDQIDSVALEATVADLITRTKGLDDIHDDLAAEITREAGSTTEDTYAHPSGTTEQDAITITTTKRTVFHKIVLYAHNLTQSTTFRCKIKDNSGTWRQIDDDYDWTTSDPAAVAFVDLVHDRDVKITMQSGTAEGASRNIPYSIIKEEMAA